MNTLHLFAGAGGGIIADMTDENDYHLTVLIVILAVWTVAYIFFGMKMIATNERMNNH